MQYIEILQAVVVIAISIVGYFLKNLHAQISKEQDERKVMADRIFLLESKKSTEMSVIEGRFHRMSDKFDNINKRLDKFESMVTALDKTLRGLNDTIIELKVNIKNN